jgi:uncharacterized repeat protein (TIGR03833 family)
MNGTKLRNIKQGAQVRVVMKQDQRSGKLTEGVVKDILTHSRTHPHGIKVRLESGIVGRVKEVLTQIGIAPGTPANASDNEEKNDE